MEIFGLIAFVLVLSSLGLHSKLKKLSSRIMKLEKVNIKREGIKMSEILKGLVGEQCTVKESSGYSNVGTVLAVDDEWIKINVVKKNIESVVVKRIENIVEVTIINK